MTTVVVITAASCRNTRWQANLYRRNPTSLTRKGQRRGKDKLKVLKVHKVESNAFCIYFITFYFINFITLLPVETEC